MRLLPGPGGPRHSRRPERLFAGTAGRFEDAFQPSPLEPGTAPGRSWDREGDSSVADQLPVHGPAGGEQAAHAASAQDQPGHGGSGSGRARDPRHMPTASWHGGAHPGPRADAVPPGCATLSPRAPSEALIALGYSGAETLGSTPVVRMAARGASAELNLSRVCLGTEVVGDVPPDSCGAPILVMPHRGVWLLCPLSPKLGISVDSSEANPDFTCRL